jgi:hypothetical protein
MNHKRENRLKGLCFIELLVFLEKERKNDGF